MITNTRDHRPVSLAPLLLLERDPALRSVTIRSCWDVPRADGGTSLFAYDITVSRTLANGRLYRTWSIEPVMGDVDAIADGVRRGARQGISSGFSGWQPTLRGRR